MPETSQDTPLRATRDVILQVPDLAAATRFYEGVMGLAVFERSPSLVGFDAGSFRLFIEQGDAPGPVFEFLAADPSDARSRLLAGGCVVVDEDATIPRCYVRNPFGLTFNIGVV